MGFWENIFTPQVGTAAAPNSFGAGGVADFFKTNDAENTRKGLNALGDAGVADLNVNGGGGSQMERNYVGEEATAQPLVPIAGMTPDKQKAKSSTAKVTATYKAPDQKDVVRPMASAAAPQMRSAAPIASVGAQQAPLSMGQMQANLARRYI